MDKGSTTQTSAEGGLSFADAEQIDRLMALPIKEPPAVIVLGDDDILGFTPAPLKQD